MRTARPFCRTTRPCPKDSSPPSARAPPASPQPHHRFGLRGFIAGARQLFFAAHCQAGLLEATTHPVPLHRVETELLWRSPKSPAPPFRSSVPLGCRRVRLPVQNSVGTEPGASSSLQRAQLRPCMEGWVFPRPLQHWGTDKGASQPGHTHGPCSNASAHPKKQPPAVQPPGLLLKRKDFSEKERKNKDPPAATPRREPPLAQLTAWPG